MQWRTAPDGHDELPAGRDRPTVGRALVAACGGGSYLYEAPPPLQGATLPSRSAWRTARRAPCFGVMHPLAADASLDSAARSGRGEAVRAYTWAPARDFWRDWHVLVETSSPVCGFVYSLKVASSAKCPKLVCAV